MVDGQYIPNLFIAPEVRHDKTSYMYYLNRESHISAHILLNLLNELGKRDKMRGLPSILSLFCNIFIKFSNTRARMLDSIYHLKIKITLKDFF